MDSFVATKKRVPTKLKTPLAHSFGFDSGDIQDNRSGFISHWQKKRLRWYLLSYTISIMTWIFLLTIFPLAFTFGNTLLAGMAMAWVTGVLVVFGMIWLWQLRSVFLDIRRGKVADLISEVGHIRQAHKKRQGVGMNAYEYNEMDYFLAIGNERFIASKEQMESFREGLLYHIYIATESRQILSAEPFKEDEMDEATDFLFEKSKVPDYLKGYDEAHYLKKEKG